MPFRLRHLQHNFELVPGEFLIGRSAECQLALDDPLVSRKHALLVITTDAVSVKDLGSRNGVVVNGTKIDGSRILLDGDKITIGSQELTVLARRTSSADLAAASRRRTGAQTLSVLPSLSDRAALEPEKEASKRIDAFPMLSALADKALALGRPEDAERILSTLMTDVVKALEEGRPVMSQTVDQAGLYGARFAVASGKGTWVDYAIKLYTLAKRPCPAAVVDELHGAVRKINAIDLTALRAYVSMLREEAAAFGPADRFLVQRIEGLERLAALR
jgi:pSer/pThr/pTyr-binding forkhead associated (FHA) protein